MANKLTKLAIWMLTCALLPSFMGSCSKDDDDDPAPQNTNTTPTPSSPIVGTWLYTDEEGGSYDNYTLVFNNDNTGYIRNEWGTRYSSSRQMNFDWSLNTASSGLYLLSIIYKSGDKEIDGPFSGGYAQYNKQVTIAGTTLSINIGDGYVMLFHRK